MDTILLVDDSSTARRLLYHALKADYRVLEAEGRDDALRQLREQKIDLVVLDMHLAPEPESASEGKRLQQEIARMQPELPVVIATGDQDHALALEMVRRGVADFLLKPVDPDVLKIVTLRALERARLELELEELRQQVRERFSFGGLIGRSRQMRELFSTLERLAVVDTTVLFLGESGTGKSALAHALHNESSRHGKPFVVVDSASIPESLIESELFGHVRGAFTGAERATSGRIRSADGGTLLLDEIGNLGLESQAKLLLFLDDRTGTPVGGVEPFRVDVRLIAATNRDLERMVRDGAFREDLLFRLQVAPVHVPPLRERKEDVVPLAEHLLVTISTELGRPRAKVTPAAAEILASYAWPGNVRQLRHVLESSLVLSEGSTLDAADLMLPAEPAVAPAGPGEGKGAKSDATFKERVVIFERGLLESALESSGGNKAAAGRLLGLDENQIRYLCRKYHLG